MRGRIAVVVPAYNEAPTLADVVKAVKETLPDCLLIIVNDGSSDDTLRVASALSANYSNIVVLSHLFNLGSGAAFQTGVAYAFIKGYDYFVRIDGDGQHNPYEVHKLLNLVISGKFDIVVGSRYLTKTGYTTSFTRKFGIAFTAKLASMLTHQKLTDVNSGYKVFNRRVANLIVKFYLPRHPAFDFILRLHKAGFRLAEVPVEMRTRKHGKSEFSYTRLILYPVRILQALIRYAISY